MVIEVQGERERGSCMVIEVQREREREKRGSCMVIEVQGEREGQLYGYRGTGRERGAAVWL